MKIHETETFKIVREESYVGGKVQGRRLTPDQMDQDRIYTARLKLDPLRDLLPSRQPDNRDKTRDYAADYLVDILDLQEPKANLLKKLWYRLRAKPLLGSVVMRSVGSDPDAEPDIRFIGADGTIVTKSDKPFPGKPFGEMTIEDGYFMSSLDRRDLQEDPPSTPDSPKPEPVLIR